MERIFSDTFDTKRRSSMICSWPESATNDGQQPPCTPLKGDGRHAVIIEMTSCYGLTKLK